MNSDDEFEFDDEFELKQTVIEVTSYDDIYNFMNRDLWKKLVDTPYTSYVDLEDPDNNNFEIKRFY